MEKTKKIAKGLSALWVVSFLIFSIGSSIYTSYAQVFRNFDPSDFTSDFHLLELGFSLLYLFPLLLVIHHFAKRAALPRFQRITVFLLVLLGSWCLCFLICVILAYAAPETFAAIIA